MGEFLKEQIPDEHDPFMRIHKTWINEGEIIPHAFTNRNDGMSTNWSKYADAVLTREQATLYGKDPNNYGIVDLSVAAVREIPNQEVEHDPLPENQAHTNVIGEKNEEARLKLKEISDWVIKFKESPS